MEPSKDSTTNNGYAKTVISAEDVHKFLGMSLSWVYEHYLELGGVKVGGSRLFPSERKIYERLFGEEDRPVHVRLSVQEKPVLRKRIQNEKGSQGGRGRKEKGVEIPTGKPNPNRHGLLGVS